MYPLRDLERIARHLTGSDFSGFFAGAVGSASHFHVRPSYGALGLRMDSFVEEMFISREPGASPAQRARFEAVFGVPGTHSSARSPATLAGLQWRDVDRDHP